MLLKSQAHPQGTVDCPSVSLASTSTRFAMSFGFSVGDFLAVGKLIAEIVASFSDAHGAKSDCEELLRELTSLDQSLRRLDQLQVSDPALAKSLEAIKYAALSCRRPLEDFLESMKRYEDTLGINSRGRSSWVKSSADKVRWSLGKKEEIAKLQGYLITHMHNVNILLAAHGLETMSGISDRMNDLNLRVRDTLKDVGSAVDRIEGDVGAQRVIVEANESKLNAFYQMVSGELLTRLKLVMSMISGIGCVLLPGRLPSVLHRLTTWQIKRHNAAYLLGGPRAQRHFVSP